MKMQCKRTHTTPNQPWYKWCLRHINPRSSNLSPASDFGFWLVDSKSWPHARFWLVGSPADKCACVCSLTLAIDSRGRAGTRRSVNAYTPRLTWGRQRTLAASAWAQQLGLIYWAAIWFKTSTFDIFWMNGWKAFVMLIYFYCFGERLFDPNIGQFRLLIPLTFRYYTLN